MAEASNPVKEQGKRERIAAALVGAFLVVIALAIVASSLQDLSVGAVVAALVIGGLGVEAVLGAARGRRCLLSRIGPLP